MKLTIVLMSLIGSLSHALTKSEIVEMIKTKSVTEGVDPDLAVAIATVESSLNPQAIGSLKEVGLFQLRPEYHDVKAGNLKHNTRIALKYLSYLKTVGDKKEMGEAWFVLFNYGPNRTLKRPRETNYYKKVMSELSRIKFQTYLAAR